MNAVALKMLFGDRAKYLGLVFGVAFASLLITQQSATFVGIMERTASVIADADEADLWVMDPQVRYLDTVRPLRETDLARVRGAPGVAWAVPLYKGNALVRTLDGRIDNALLLGVDDATLIGTPRRLLLGTLEDLRQPDAVAVDAAGYRRLWPGTPMQLGQELELNDRRAVVAAITDATAAFSATIIVYARYSLATAYVPQGRNMLSFILARSAAGETPEQAAVQIHEATGLQALSASAFKSETIKYYLANTGIPISFGVVILLGVVVGVAIVGLTFNMFVADNIRQFGALKAIGLTNGGLIRMVLLQAAVVSGTGYGLGTGLAAAFFALATRSGSDLRGFTLPWWVAAGMAGLLVAIMLLATATSLRRVLRLDPATAFRG